MTMITTVDFRISNHFRNKHIDFVLLIDNDVRKTANFQYLVNFVDYLEQRGVQFQINYGDIPNNVYICLHFPTRAIKHFANLYNIEIYNELHNYIPVFGVKHHLFHTPLTLHRADILRDQTEMTSLERITVVNQVLKDAEFGGSTMSDMYGLRKMRHLGIIKSAYPLHDGPFDDRSDDKSINDRKLLLNHWANYRVWYKVQPLNLIEKYFGSEVALYFAWLGFYNLMLIPATVVGVVCFCIGLFRAFAYEHLEVEDICFSNLTMCPVCFVDAFCRYRSLNSSCTYARTSYVFDHRFTIFFSVFMSFWATLFVNLWKREENMLKVRWNVEFVDSDTKLRLEYKERANKKKISIVTGQLEPYIPPSKKIFYHFITYASLMLFIVVVVLCLFIVVIFRILIAGSMKISNNEFAKNNFLLVSMTTSSLLQVIIIKIFTRFYARLSVMLTVLENPRTQTEFDDSVVQKRFFLGFVNDYSSLFYIAFVKGRFFLPDHRTLTGSIETDVCDPPGCLLALCNQLVFHMVFKSFAGNLYVLIEPKIKQCFRKRKRKFIIKNRWEEDYLLSRPDRYAITSEFTEMVIQYGFITFFVSAFPLGPLFALLNNIIELRLDAVKLVTRYRRPLPRKQAGIGPWNNILTIITRISIATNAFVVAFTSEFVPKQIYRHRYGNVKGYVESTLSVFDMKDHLNQNISGNLTSCYYMAGRYPPDHINEYELTYKYWYEIGMRLLCVIVFEHLIFILNGLLAYVIPPMPEKVKEVLNHQRSVQRNLKLKVLDDNFRKSHKNNKSTLELRK